MTEDYLRAVSKRLAGLSRSDRQAVLAALAAQLDELTETGLDPMEALGDPASYSDRLSEALGSEPSADDASWRVFGIPVETRGPVSADVRSRIWDPANPRIFVPRLFGAGWTLNLGAVAVRMGLIRPDDTGDDVLAAIPQRYLRAAQAVPLAIASATAAELAFAWRRLPPKVASGFTPGGRARGEAPRPTLIGVVALGVGPALWAQRRDVPVEDRLVRAATATSLAAISAGMVTATIAQTRKPRARSGLLLVAALPIAVATAVSVIVAPLRSGLRGVWRTAAPEPAKARDAKPRGPAGSSLTHPPETSTTEGQRQ